MRLRTWIAFAFVTVVALGVLGLFPTTPQVAHAQGQYGLCVSAATSPGCQSSSYGDATIAASAQTVTINTTAVTANSPILLTYDYSLGTPLGVTCNTTGQTLEISARTTGTSFTVKAVTGTFSTNPGCFTWQVLPQ